MKQLMTLSAAVLFVACGPDNLLRAEDQIINGQVFIATAGGENIKLALVPVSLFLERDARTFVAEKDRSNRDRVIKIDRMVQVSRSAARAATAICNKAMDEEVAHIGDKSFDAHEADAKKAAQELHHLNETEADWHDLWAYVHSSLYYFDGMAAPLTTSKTDADGKFQIPVPSPGIWVLRANASRKAGTKTEFYSWLVAVPVNGPTTVMLANDNDFGSHAESCLVRDGTDQEVAAYHGMKLLPEAEEKFAREDADAKRIAAQESERQRRALQARLPQLVKESQARALKKHPDLGKAGSDLNKKFVARYADLLAKKDSQLEEPDWPEKLADECAVGAEALANR